jgi:hypothetical protein
MKHELIRKANGYKIDKSFLGQRLEAAMPLVLQNLLDLQ